MAQFSGQVSHRWSTSPVSEPCLVFSTTKSRLNRHKIVTNLVLLLLGLLLPTLRGLLPIGQRMTSGSGGTPPAARSDHRIRVIAVEYIDAAAEATKVLDHYTVDQKENR